jgi:hypothetical protein
MRGKILGRRNPDCGGRLRIEDQLDVGLISGVRDLRPALLGSVRGDVVAARSRSLHVKGSVILGCCGEHVNEPFGDRSRYHNGSRHAVTV